jgi:cyanophycinase
LHQYASEGKRTRVEKLATEENNRMKRWLAALVPCLAALATFAQTESLPQVGPAKGSLVIVGGGKIPPSISDRFIELAGGREAEVVYIPTASGDEVLSRSAGAPPQLFGLKNVTVLHTRDRRVADTESFAAPLRQATGIWFGGGQQSRLADAYGGTLTLKEIWKVLERGGVVGGSSAGASIQASYLMGAQDEAAAARAYTAGFGFLKNTAIDQHVNTRRREMRVVPVIAAHPELLGIGIDESTAIIVKGDQFEVIGAGQVAITDGKRHDGRSYYFVSPGKKFDLKKRERL